MATAEASSELKIVEDATCTFCGCVCDDIELHVEGHQIKKAVRGRRRYWRKRSKGPKRSQAS